MAPIIKIAINHLLWFLNTSLIDYQYSFKGIGFSSLFSLFLIKKIIISTEIIQNIGMEKNGINHTINVSAEPKIGLNTFPIVLDVSMIPNVALASSSF